MYFLLNVTEIVWTVVVCTIIKKQSYRYHTQKYVLLYLLFLSPVHTFPLHRSDDRSSFFLFFRTTASSSHDFDDLVLSVLWEEDQPESQDQQEEEKVVIDLQAEIDWTVPPRSDTLLFPKGCGDRTVCHPSCVCHPLAKALPCISR